jgi:hypothetical protein
MPDMVRFAVPQDARQLLDLVRLVHAESGLFPLSEAKVRHEIDGSIRQETGVIGVIGAPGSPVGAAWLVGGADWYTETPALVERFIFVHPDHREGTRHAYDLLAWAQGLSDRCGPLLIGVMSSRQRGAAKLRFYRRRFGEPTGFYFAYGLKGNGRPHVDAEATIARA